MNAPLRTPLEGLRYGALGFPLAFVALPLYVVLPNLYARELGAPLGLLGLVLLGTRLFDAFVDPALGRLCDRRFASSLARVLRLMAASAVLLALGLAALLFAPVRGNLLLVWAAAALTIGVLAFLEFVVEPRLFKRERFSSLLAVIVLLVLADEYGFIGILVAPPLAAALQIFAGQIMRVTTRSMLAPAAPIVFAQPIEVLQTRLASVEARLAAQPEPAPELLNVVKRLTQLIDQASQAEPQPLGKNG